MPENWTFPPLSYYLNTAENLIKKKAAYLISDDDAVGTVVRFMLQADYDYDGRGTMNRDGYRIKMGYYGISNSIRTKVSEIKRRENTISVAELNHVAINCKGNLFGFNSLDKLDNHVFQESHVKELEDKDAVNFILAKKALSERESEILRLRYIQGCTLAEVGTELSITRERVRQLLKTIIPKVRKYMGVSDELVQ